MVSSTKSRNWYYDIHTYVYIYIHRYIYCMLCIYIVYYILYIYKYVYDFLARDIHVGREIPPTRLGFRCFFEWPSEKVPSQNQKNISSCLENQEKLDLKFYICMYTSYIQQPSNLRRLTCPWVCPGWAPVAVAMLSDLGLMFKIFVAKKTIQL